MVRHILNSSPGSTPGSRLWQFSSPSRALKGVPPGNELNLLETKPSSLIASRLRLSPITAGSPRGASGFMGPRKMSARARDRRRTNRRAGRPRRARRQGPDDAKDDLSGQSLSPVSEEHGEARLNFPMSNQSPGLTRTCARGAILSPSSTGLLP